MTLADYRDGIHVNEKGQKVIAEYLNRCIEEIYKKK
jgi:lysophospholipase L1-like esterase